MPILCFGHCGIRWRAKRHPGAELRDLEMGNDFINVRMYYVGKLEELEKLVIIYLVSEGFLRKECLH